MNPETPIPLPCDKGIGEEREVEPRYPRELRSSRSRRRQLAEQLGELRQSRLRLSVQVGLCREQPLQLSRFLG